MVSQRAYFSEDIAILLVLEQSLNDSCDPPAFPKINLVTNHHVEFVKKEKKRGKRKVFSPTSAQREVSALFSSAYRQQEIATLILDRVSGRKVLIGRG